MKSSHRIYTALSVRILLVILPIVFTFCLGHANAASELGTVTIVLEAEPMNLDSGNTAASGVGRVFLKNVFETLTEMDPVDSSIAPGLSTSWKQINATTWHFFLRKGVKFHDGADFNAEAVIFNIKRLYDQRIFSRTRSRFFSDFKMEGEALDSHMLEVKTDKPQPLLPTLVSALSICSPNTPLGKLTQHPIGTGPYRFVKWDTGVQIILERFNGYWGKLPQVQKGIYVWRGQSSVRASMVLIGEADLAPNIARQDANRPDMDYSYLNSETVSIRFSHEWEPPFNDRRVRLALNYAIDRDGIRGSILSKDVIPATQMVVPSIFGYNPDLKVWPYDPQKAKQLLDAARKEGVPVDKEILILGRSGHFPGIEELLEALMSMYKAVGLNVKLKMLEVAVISKINTKPYPKDMGPCIISNNHDNNTGDAVFTVFYKYHCNGQQSSICDKELDDLIDKAQVATGEERRKLWQATFKRIHEEIIPEAMLFHLVGSCRVGKRINFKPSLTTNSAMPLAQITFK